MGVAIGSSIQIALFVTPFLVILGWIMNKDMDLHFETCKHSHDRPSSSLLTAYFTVETVAFALSVLVVIYTVTDGKSNYLEGAMVSSLFSLVSR
jgi:Ca2+:H+ antiporter